MRRKSRIRRTTEQAGRPDPAARRRERTGRERRITYTRLLGMGFCVAGFIAIGLGWNGMARIDFASGQLPYLLSGGATGVGLIVFGVGLLVMAQTRADRLRAELHLEELVTSLGRSAAPAIAAGEESSEPNGQIRVVAGPAAYHRSDCRLLKGKTGLTSLSLDDARASGLAPCRVCSPLEQDAPPQGREAGPGEPVEVTPGGTLEATSPGPEGRPGVRGDHGGAEPGGRA